MLLGANIVYIYTIRFCGHCLKKFYKESAAAIPDKSKWICASCRGICCCAACRRRKSRSGQQHNTYNTTQQSTNAHSNTNNKSNTKKLKIHHKQPNTNNTYNNNATNNQSHANASHQTTTKPLPPLSAPIHNSSTTHSPAMRSSTIYSTSPAIRGLTSPSFPLDTAFLTSPTAGNLFEFDIRGDYDINNDYANTAIDYSDDDTHSVDSMNDTNITTVPETQFYNLLGTHIRTLANEAYKNPQSTFAKLYRTTQQPNIKRKISAILARQDLKRQDKVELIANMLMPLQQNNTSTSDSCK